MFGLVPGLVRNLFAGCVEVGVRGCVMPYFVYCFVDFLRCGGEAFDSEKVVRAGWFKRYDVECYVLGGPYTSKEEHLSLCFG